MSAKAAYGLRKKALVSTAVAACALVFAPDAAARAAAGESVTNTAGIAYAVDGTQGSTSSNTVTNRIDEILDVTLTPKSDGTASVPPTGLAAFGVPFVLTNTGNGTEAFQVKATSPGQALTVAIDVDGNGAYDPAVDIIVPPEGATPALAPGASLNLLLRFTEAPVEAGTATISVAAVTGSGTPGTVYAGQGDGGSDAVVGSTRAEASLPVAYQRGTGTDPGTPASATLEKSQIVRAPDGSANPVQGAVITYRLALSTAGTEALTDAEIVDPIPAGTAFVPGSIQIENVAASDASDADAAFFDGQAIRIALGEISQPTTRVVSFQVTIQ